MKVFIERYTVTLFMTFIAGTYWRNNYPRYFMTRSLSSGWSRPRSATLIRSSCVTSVPCTRRPSGVGPCRRRVTRLTLSSPCYSTPKSRSNTGWNVDALCCVSSMTEPGGGGGSQQEWGCHSNARCCLINIWNIIISILVYTRTKSALSYVWWTVVQLDVTNCFKLIEHAWIDRER